MDDTVYEAKFYLTDNVPVDAVIYDGCTQDQVYQRIKAKLNHYDLPLKAVGLSQWISATPQGPDFVLIAWGFVTDNRIVRWVTLED